MKTTNQIQDLHASICGDEDVLRLVSHGLGDRQRGGGLGFALEAREPVRIGNELSREHLEGHVASEAGLGRSIDLTHTAAAERSHDPLRSQ